MPIKGMLGDCAFAPEQVGELVAAFESVLADLKLVDRKDPVTEMVAKIIIVCAKQGMFDRIQLHDCAMDALTKH